MNELELERTKMDVVAWLNRYENMDISLPALCQRIEADLPSMLQDLVLADLQNQCYVEGAKARIRYQHRDLVTNGIIVSSQFGDTRENYRWQILSEVEADYLQVKLLPVPDLPITDFCESPADQITGLGKIKAVEVFIARQLEHNFTHYLRQPITRVVYRLVSLAVCVVETAYAILEDWLKKRLRRLSIEIYTDMYTAVRAAFPNDPQSACQIFLCAACAPTNVIYAPDPYAIDASFRISEAYKNVDGLSPLDIASRFWDSFARTASAFPISFDPANANLLKSPYASTRWQFAERVMYRGTELRGQILAEVSNIRIEAWYPSVLAAKIDAVLPIAQHPVHAILRKYRERIKNDLGDLSTNVLPGADGGFIAGSSLIIETLAGLQPPASKAKDQERWNMDNESREAIAVHHVGLIVSEAGQIYRGYTNGDHGIDAEIEFKDDQGHASGKRLYLQLKSGDSYLRKRQRDGQEVFYVKKTLWADYWQQQAYPVMLVVRTADGEVRWMNVSSYLKNECQGQAMKQIVFQGESFDVGSISRWRSRLLEV